MAFTRPTMRQLREEIDNALKPLAEKHGISFNLGSISFSSDSFSVSLKGKTLDESGTPVVDAATFTRYCGMYGLKPEDLGRKFMSRGHVYEITGVAPNRPKYPINAKRSDGKQFKFASTIGMQFLS